MTVNELDKVKMGVEIPEEGEYHAGPDLDKGDGSANESSHMGSSDIENNGAEESATPEEASQTLGVFIEEGENHAEYIENKGYGSANEVAHLESSDTEEEDNNLCTQNSSQAPHCETVHDADTASEQDDDVASLYNSISEKHKETDVDFDKMSTDTSLFERSIKIAGEDDHTKNAALRKYIYGCAETLIDLLTKKSIDAEEKKIRNLLFEYLEKHIDASEYCKALPTVKATNVDFTNVMTMFAIADAKKPKWSTPELKTLVASYNKDIDPEYRPGIIDTLRFALFGLFAQLLPKVAISCLNGTDSPFGRALRDKTKYEPIKYTMKKVLSNKMQHKKTQLLKKQHDGRSILQLVGMEQVEMVPHVPQFVNQVVDSPSNELSEHDGGSVMPPKEEQGVGAAANECRVQDNSAHVETIDQANNNKAASELPPDASMNQQGEKSVRNEEHSSHPIYSADFLAHKKALLEEIKRNPAKMKEIEDSFEYVSSDKEKEGEYSSIDRYVVAQHNIENSAFALSKKKEADTKDQTLNAIVTGNVSVSKSVGCINTIPAEKRKGEGNYQSLHVERFKDKAEEQEVLRGLSADKPVTAIDPAVQETMGKLQSMQTEKTGVPNVVDDTSSAAHSPGANVAVPG